MDSKVFSDRGLASILTNFVCVRVDRDEQPHIDRLFQAAVGGGYPVNCVLTADKKVVVAANFVPLHDTMGQAGLVGLLSRVLELWSKDRPTLLRDARSLEPEPQPAQPVRIGEGLFEDQVVKLLMDYDWELGGVLVNRQRRFPQPTVNRLLLAYSARTGDTLGLQASSIALRKMYYGGIMDQVGGGFHRSADAQWDVPSFEKLLVDNAELASDYANQYLATGDEEFLDALNLTLGFMVSELWLGDGFAVSLASDGQKEGEYYTWTPGELDEALGPQLSRVGRNLFGIHPIAVSADPYSRRQEATGAVVAGRIVPRRMMDIEDLAKTLGTDVSGAWHTLGEIRAKMRAYRDSTRKRPARDASEYTHPNMLAAEALVLGYAATRRAELLEKSLAVVWRLKPKVSRRLGGGREGLAEDYGAALNALVSAYEASGQKGLLWLALQVAERLEQLLGPDGFPDQRGGHPTFASKLDSPNESPNALCFRGLLRVAALAGRPQLAGKLRERLGALLGGLWRQRLPLVASHYLNVDRVVVGPTQVVVVDTGDRVSGALHEAALGLYHPFRVVQKLDEAALREHPNPAVRALRADGPRAYVGVGFEPSFDRSTDDPASLRAYLRTGLPQTYNY